MEENQSQPTNASEVKTSSNPLGMLVIVGVVVLIAVGGFLVFSRKGTAPREMEENQSMEAETMQPDSADMAMEKTHTLSDIAQHATAEDCWFAVDGKVYDATQFIASNRHPGGVAIIEGCGKDATQLFNTRPMGSGTPHSDNARANLPNFQIGLLKE